MTKMQRADNQPEKESKFHWLFLPGERPREALYDTIVEESANFAVLPTKGSIVPGWVLIVPKFPVCRMADVPKNLSEELIDLARLVAARIEAEFGPVYFFEHGGQKGSKIACGVDQAHLHIVPLSFDLMREAEANSPGAWRNLGSDFLPLNDLPEDEYWFVSGGGEAKYKIVGEPSSQFFRKIIALHSGQKDAWDYRDADFIGNVGITLSSMSANG